MRVIATIVLMLGLCSAAACAGDGPPAAKWPTDEPLRKGMLAIRDLVRLNHSLITHRRMPPDHAARFAKAIKAQADAMLGTSAVSGEAKERLRALLDEIVAGVEAVAGRKAGVAPMDGLVQVDEALARYPERFDHPGWTPLQSLNGIESGIEVELTFKIVRGEKMLVAVKPVREIKEGDDQFYL